MNRKSAFGSIDEYIDSFSEETQQILKRIRQIIKNSVPDAYEKMSYQMPTFYLNGNLVHFAAFPKHIGFYPTPMGIEAFHEALFEYKRGKGSVQFPIHEPLPYDLIECIVKYRAKQNRIKKG